MFSTATARTRTRGSSGLTALAMVAATAAAIGLLLHDGAPSHQDHGRSTARDDRPVAGDDGALPEGVTVFDGEYRGVANLDPDLLHALREAATDAAGEGIEFLVNSGWRSAEYQDRLLHEAMREHGAADAARWVATADTSAHVTGDAVDLDVAARAWLAEHGAAYGLCPIYRNEPWHYELHPEASEVGCPAMYPDPTHDPRLQR